MHKSIFRGFRNRNVMNTKKESHSIMKSTVDGRLTTVINNRGQVPFWRRSRKDSTEEEGGTA